MTAVLFTGIDNALIRGSGEFAYLCKFFFLKKINKCKDDKHTEIELFHLEPMLLLMIQL